MTYKTAKEPAGYIYHANGRALFLMQCISREGHKTYRYFAPDGNEVGWFETGNETIHIYNKNKDRYPELVNGLIAYRPAIDFYD